MLRTRISLRKKKVTRFCLARHLWTSLYTCVGKNIRIIGNSTKAMSAVTFPENQANPPKEYFSRNFATCLLIPIFQFPGFPWCPRHKQPFSINLFKSIYLRVYWIGNHPQTAWKFGFPICNIPLFSVTLKCSDKRHNRTCQDNPC